MAVALARGSAPFSPSFQFKDSKKSLKPGFRVSCVYSSSDPYSTLRIRPDASESEVKKAFRKLALKYHPDVCRGDSCEIRFLQINEAYNTVINNLREQASISNLKTRYGDYACRSMMQTQTRHDDYYESNVREPTPWYKMDTSYGNFDYELKSKDESSRVYEEDLCEEWMGF